MFKFLKDKLKAAVSKFSRKIDEEGEEDNIEVEETEEVVEEKSEEKVKEPVEEEKEAEEVEEKPVEEKRSEKKEEPVEEVEEKPVEEEKEEEKEQVEEVKEEKEEEESVEEKEEKEEEPVEEKKEEQVEEKEPELEKEELSSEEEEKVEEEVEEKKGFFAKIKDRFRGKEEKEVEDIEKEGEEIKEEELKEEIIEEKEEESVEEKKEEQVEEKEPEEVDEVIEEEKPEESKKITSEIKEDIKKLEEESEEEEKLEEDIIEKEKELAKEEPKVEEKPEEDIEKTIEEEKEKIEEEKKELKEEIKEAKKVPEEVEEKKGLFAKLKQTITTKKVSEDKFAELFWEIEVALLENSVAVEVIEKIKNDLKGKIVNKAVSRKDIETIVATSMMQSIEELFDQPEIDVIANIEEKKKEKKPYVICFVGINGSGKTTTIAKFAYMLKEKGYSSVIAASDTFRAAAIDQLEIHADKLGVKLIKHDYNADPAAVAFDAIKHAESKNRNVVLIDTAGRLHSNTNLMEELQKIVKVSNPDLTIFLGEAITGNDCIEQAREFDKIVDIDGIILSKADVDQKGGAAISISYVLKKPILYLGVGQNYEDLRKFSVDFITEQLSI